jgi:hypothetical protein
MSTTIILEAITVACAALVVVGLASVIFMVST